MCVKKTKQNKEVFLSTLVYEYDSGHKFPASCTTLKFSVLNTALFFP